MRKRNPTRQAALRYLAEAAKALNAGEPEKLVHRDVKPENLVLTGKNKKITISDFGLGEAKQDDEEELDEASHASIPLKRSILLTIFRLSDYDNVLEGNVNNVTNRMDMYALKGHGGPMSSVDQTIKELIAGLPDDYEGRAAALSAINSAVRQEMAAQLAPVLNAKIQAMPHETLDEKKELARWVNDELEPLGLAVQCPNTRLPAKLRGIAGHWPGRGRFAFEINKDGKRGRPAVSDDLPELTLTDATPPKEPEAKWQQTVGPKASRSGRKLS